jgi:hypothetical protein
MKSRRAKISPPVKSSQRHPASAISSMIRHTSAVESSRERAAASPTGRLL